MAIARALDVASTVVIAVVSSVNRSARNSQGHALVAYAPFRALQVIEGQLFGLTVIDPGPGIDPKISQAGMIAVISSETATLVRIGQSPILVVYSSGETTFTRGIAWPFVMDGNVFYVLDLGAQGTFAYNTVTKQWSKFQTDGFVGWNMRNGVMFSAGRVAAADKNGTTVWELDPLQTMDEDGAKDIHHTVTGGLATRGPKFYSVEALRLTVSMGDNTSPTGATISMEFSDDKGRTWNGPFTIDLTENSWTEDVIWPSLGAFSRPGRIFRITDVGGPVRIDAADASIENFDEDNSQGSQGQQ